MQNLGQVIKLYPTDEQIIVMEKACGTARFAYNWGLINWQRLKSEGVARVTKNDLKKEWNRVKPSWVYEAPKDANQRPFTDLYNALNKYFNKQAKFPKLKKKGKCEDSFYISNDI